MRFIIPFSLFLSIIFSQSVLAQTQLDALVPVRGLCIAAPQQDQVDDFILFIQEELTPKKVNTLVLRIDYNYQYESHPELRNENTLSRKDVKKLVKTCNEGGIKIVPQINLLGHQSWAEKEENLLKVYPQFDETPSVKMPEKYDWPNEDGLYCKSYYLLHPEVHEIVFALVDEIMEVFEADAFHAGLDEVFYIGEEECPRCSGRDKAALFAGEVNRIRNHLALSGKELWMWGDRLIDGKTTGIGMWEASMNNTHRAIDLIAKDVVICDWHYTRAVPTAAYFAMKGFRVITCPWRIPEVAVKQLESTLLFRAQSPPEMKENFAGMMHTVWSGPQSFMDQYYGKTASKNSNGESQVDCFNALFEAIGELKEK